MPRSSRWFACLVLGGMALTACSDVLDVEDVVGVWNTASINGDPVPGEVLFDGLIYDVQYWRWTFNNGGLCSTTSQIELVEDTRACEYVVYSQSRRVSVDFGFATVEGAVDGDRMTVTDEGGNIFLLRKQ